MPITVTSVSSSATRLGPEPVPTIRPSELQKTIAKGPVVVEFFNYGCPYCRAAIPSSTASPRRRWAR
jgi:thiol-disulfide isomerase/thioredoxin